MKRFEVKFFHNWGKHYRDDCPYGTECVIIDHQEETTHKAYALLSKKDRHFNKAIGRKYSFMRAIRNFPNRQDRLLIAQDAKIDQIHFKK